MTTAGAGQALSVAQGSTMPPDPWGWSTGSSLPWARSLLQVRVWCSQAPLNLNPRKRSAEWTGGDQGEPGGATHPLPGVSPVPSQRQSTGGRRVAPCSSFQPGAGRWHRTASPPPSSGCPGSPRCARRTALSTGDRGDSVSRAPTQHSTAPAPATTWSG